VARYRLWRGAAGLLSWALPSGKAVNAQPGGLPERVAALEDKLAAVTFDAVTNVLTITGANLRIVNGLGGTETTNGLGNLIVGYNESRVPFAGTDNRTGSHNVVVGEQLNFSGFVGLVVGFKNEIASGFSSVLAGFGNTASGFNSSVCGGEFNTASGDFSSVSGGSHDIASGNRASVSGGLNRTAPAQFNWAAGALFQAN
jgi:hypothetical protein